MDAPGPEPARPPAPGLAMQGVVHRNIQALLEVRRQFERRKSIQERIADTITRFAGTMAFVYVHAGFYGGWLAVNAGLAPGLRPWDPFPFVMLAMIASVEAIFLSTFILISQNRMQVLVDRRAELDLQISLLAEHEVTRLIHMVDAMMRHLRIPQPAGDIGELKRDVRPEQVVREIERAEGDAAV